MIHFHPLPDHAPHDHAPHWRHSLWVAGLGFVLLLLALFLPYAAH